MPSWREQHLAARSTRPHGELDETDSDNTTRRTRAARLRRGLGVVAATGLVASALAVVLPASSAGADPSANDWYRLRMCESSNNYSINTGNGYYGAYQFDLPTWRSVGGTGLPSNASKAEQDKRALMLYHSRGWQPWTCARIVGLTGGGSGGSSHHSGTSKTTKRTPHGWPGVHYQYGDHSSKLVTWQKQMRKRGATILHGTGQYGPKTSRVAKAIQLQNGLGGSGTIGPKTWELAWTGTFHASAALRAPVSKPAKHTSKPKTTHTSKPKTKHTTKRSTPHVRKAPAWPGRVYGYGDWNSHIAAWQKQMAKRGAPLQGTGEFGSTTYSVAKALQRQNGLDVVGYIGPKTWAAAWTGTYHAAKHPKAKVRKAPAWPGRVYGYGDWNSHIAAWQKQMAKRGAPLQGTGEFGSTTYSVAKALQRQNGLDVVGYIGPKTWAAAWTGTYHR